MSYERSPGDVLAIIDQLYRKCEAAGGKYLEVSGELGSLHDLLRHLYEIESQESFHSRHNSKNESQLISIIRDCYFTLGQLDDLLHRYRRTGHDRDNRGSPRLGHSEIDSLNDIRVKLHNHITAVAVFLDTIQLRHDAHLSKTVDGQGGQLDIILDKLDKIAERMGQRTGSVLTTYGTDDKEIWKEFRRELIAEGFSSDVLQRNKDVLRAYIREIDQKGLLVDDPPTPISASHSVSSEWLHSLPQGQSPGTEAGHFPRNEAAKQIVVDEDNIKFPQSMKAERASVDPHKTSRDIEHAISSLRIDTELDRRSRDKRSINSPRVDLEEASSSDESYTSSRHASPVSFLQTSDFADSRNFSPADKNFLRPPPSRQPSHIRLAPQGNSRPSSPASIHSNTSTGSRSRPSFLNEQNRSSSDLRDYSSSPRRSGSIPIPAKDQRTDGQDSRNPRTNSFTLGPDSMGNEIPRDAKWTKIKRSLISLEVLERDGHRYEARPDFVAILGVLSREEVEDLALRSLAAREARYHRHESLRERSPRQAPPNFRFTRAKRSGYGTPSEDSDSEAEPERHSKDTRRTRSPSIQQTYSKADWSPNLAPPPGPGFWPPANYGYPYGTSPDASYGANIQPPFGYPPQPYYSHTYPPPQQENRRHRRHGESSRSVSQGREVRNAGKKRWRENLAAAGLGGAAVSLLSVLSEAAAEF